MRRHGASDGPGSVSRRTFLQVTGAVAAGSALPAVAVEPEPTPAAEAKIKRFRTLGRTGFEVSDLSIGGEFKEANVVRYALERGVNYIDTAEGYGNGDSERKIGEALQHVDRGKVFITTKLLVEEKDTVDTLVDRFGKCQERLKTGVVDALFMHSVNEAATVSSEAFHAAFRRLKEGGRVRFAGISCHGPAGRPGDSMEKVLGAAVEDGRFDLLLLVYNFLNREEGEKVLAACKSKNVGTTAMKTSPASLKVEPFDPANPTGEYADAMKRLKERGLTDEEATARIQRWVQRSEEESAKARPFAEQHGASTDEKLRQVALQWALANPDLHTVCLSLPDFDSVDRFLPLSGTSMTQAAARFIEDYRIARGHLYCRHGCSACASACPHGVPVSTVMRYASYFQHQGREKVAMQKYARLTGRDGSLCLTCDGPCLGACPHRFPIQAGLVRAHSLLVLA
jgi:predicted aldo/keto reductase-like oxidoreductase